MSYRLANRVGPNHCSVPYRLAGYDPICVIQVGQCSWPKSFLHAIQVGRIQYLSMPYRKFSNHFSMPYRLANVVGPNHFSVPYRSAGSDTYPCHTGRPMQLAQFISPCHMGWLDMILSMSYRSANALGPNHSPVPYRLAGSDTYPCHTGWPMHLAQIIALCHTGWPMHLAQIIAPCHTGWPDMILSVSYRLANAVGPNHFSVPYRLAGSDPYPCHTGRPMHLAQIIAPCHTGWLDLIPIRVIQVGQCTWPKSLLRAIQVGQIRYLCMSYRSANALGPNHRSVPYRLAGSDTYPCHTGWPIELAQIIAPCHTGWPDMILSVSYRSANAVGPNHFSMPYRLAEFNTYPCQPV